MRLELIIDGMLAVHAKYAVFTALAAVEGVERAEVELGRATLEIAAARPDTFADEALSAALEDAVRAAIEAAGFTVREVRRLPRGLPLL